MGKMTSFSSKKARQLKHGAKWGQHLLTSRVIARATVDAGGVQEGDMVLEVGPGTGMLTRELLETGAHVVAVEKDPSMVAVLKHEFKKEIDDVRLTMYEGDIRDAAILKSIFLNRASFFKVVANIPYYITGELLRLFLTARPQPQSISFLVQKEVAERIAKSKKESILSLSVKVYGTPRYIKTVRAGSFNPPPSVDSAILAITDISRKNFTPDAGAEARFFELLHIGFGQKRKTLMGNLKRSAYGRRTSVEWEGVWKKAGLEKNVRAEDVPLEVWLGLTNALSP